MPADASNYYKTIRKTCLTANTVYLVIRLFYLVLFLIAKFYILAIVDGVSILLYSFFYFVIKKRKYYIYALLCGNEFFAFIITTTVMLGFGSAFPFYLIGLCIVSFFTTYFQKVKNFKGSIIWVFICATIFLTTYLITEFNEPYYQIEKWLEMTLFITHSIIVFTFVCVYMLVFVRYATKLENKIMNESRTDELTQINNRYALYDYLEEEKDKSSLTLALFDIDDFKSINDTFGHVTGDMILKRMAEIATDVLEESFVCRYGGEEFIVVIKGEKEDVRDKLEELRKAIAKEVFEYKDAKISITVTIGAVAYSDEMPTERWLELADKKMYSGKKQGKNRLVF